MLQDEDIGLLRLIGGIIAVRIYIVCVYISSISRGKFRRPLAKEVSLLSDCNCGKSNDIDELAGMRMMFCANAAVHGELRGAEEHRLHD